MDVKTLCVTVGTTPDSMFSVIRRYLEYFDVKKVVFLATEKTKQYVGREEGLDTEVKIVSPSSYEENLKLKLECDAIDITGGTKQMASVFSIIAVKNNKGISYLEGPGYFRSSYPEVPRWLQKFESYNLNFAFRRPYVKELPATLPSINNFSYKHEYLTAFSKIVNYFDEGELTLKFVNNSVEGKFPRKLVEERNFTVYPDDRKNFEVAVEMAKMLKKLYRGSSPIDQLEAVAGLKSVRFSKVEGSDKTEVSLDGLTLLPDTNFFYNVDAYRLLYDKGPVIYVSDCIRHELCNKVSPDLNKVQNKPNLDDRVVACLAYHQFLSLSGFGKTLPIEAEESYCDKEIANEYLEHLNTKMYLVTSDRDVLEKVNNLRKSKLLNPPLTYNYAEPEYERSLGTYALFKLVGLIIYLSLGEGKAVISGKREGKDVEVYIELAENINDRRLNCDKLYGSMFRVIVLR